MKLHEIKALRRGAAYKETIEVEPGGGIYGKFDVDVEFDYEPESVTQHVMGDPTTRERHSAQIDIDSIVTAEKVEERDQDGKVVKTWPKGTDVSELPGWDDSDDDYVLDELRDKLSHQGGDLEPFDDDYDRYNDR